MRLILKIINGKARRLKLYQRHAEREIKKAVIKKGARNQVRTLKRNVPVGDTGALKASIHSRTTHHGLRYTLVAATTYAIYANYQLKGRLTKTGYVEFKKRIDASRRHWFEPKGFKRAARALRRGTRKAVKEVSARLQVTKTA